MLIVTVPVTFFPPIIVTGFSVKPDTDGGFTVRFAEADPPFAVAETVATVCTDTDTVLTEIVTVDLPAATKIELGTVTDVEELDKLTERPPVGAGPLKVTVPVDVAEPTKLEGARDIDVTVGARIPRAV